MAGEGSWFCTSLACTLCTNTFPNTATLLLLHHSQRDRLRLLLAEGRADLKLAVFKVLLRHLLPSSIISSKADNGEDCSNAGNDGDDGDDGSEDDSEDDTEDGDEGSNQAAAAAAAAAADAVSKQTAGKLACAMRPPLHVPPLALPFALTPTLTCTPPDLCRFVSTRAGCDWSQSRPTSTSCMVGRTGRGFGE